MCTCEPRWPKDELQGSSAPLPEKLTFLEGNWQFPAWPVSQYSPELPLPSPYYTLLSKGRTLGPRLQNALPYRLFSRAPPPYSPAVGLQQGQCEPARSCEPRMLHSLTVLNSLLLVRPRWRIYWLPNIDPESVWPLRFLFQPCKFRRRDMDNCLGCHLGTASMRAPVTHRLVLRTRDDNSPPALRCDECHTEAFLFCSARRCRRLFARRFRRFQTFDTAGLDAHRRMARYSDPQRSHCHYSRCHARSADSKRKVATRRDWDDFRRCSETSIAAFRNADGICVSA